MTNVELTDEERESLSEYLFGIDGDRPYLVIEQIVSYHIGSALRDLAFEFRKLGASRTTTHLDVANTLTTAAHIYDAE